MATTSEPPKVADVLRDIGHDVKTIAVDELELARRQLEMLVLKACVALLGATVALIGLGMLCMVAVAASEPIIEPLWLRLLLFAVVYIVVGGAAAYGFAVHKGLRLRGGSDA